jgi:hypothetical protein
LSCWCRLIAFWQCKDQAKSHVTWWFIFINPKLPDLLIHFL